MALDERVDTLEGIARETSASLKRMELLQEQTNKALEGIVGALTEHTSILKQHTEVLNKQTDILNQHTGLLQSLVSTTQGHSIDLTLIKKYLDTSGPPSPNAPSDGP